MDDRIRKANKISSILGDYYNGELQSFVCLDLGCSRGIISAALSLKFYRIIGMDIDIELLRTAQKAKLSKTIPPYYISGSGYNLPFPDATFDVIIFAQVYEHVTKPQIMVNEITRALKPGGVCFFSGPNRLAIMEEHYWLPFLSWLPNPISSFFIKIMHRGTVYDIYPLTYWQLFKLWNGFTIHDYTMRILRESKKYSVSERVDKYSFLRYIPDWLIKILQPFYPNYNWILVKKP